MLSYQKNGDCTMLDNVVVAALSLGYRYLDRENGIFAKPIGWLSELTDLRDYIFKNTNLWFKPTNEK